MNAVTLQWYPAAVAPDWHAPLSTEHGLLNLCAGVCP
jgi:hypothetical protein